MAAGPGTCSALLADNVVFRRVAAILCLSWQTTVAAKMLLFPLLLLRLRDPLPPARFRVRVSGDADGTADGAPPAFDMRRGRVAGLRLPGLPGH